MLLYPCDDDVRTILKRLSSRLLRLGYIYINKTKIKQDEKFPNTPKKRVQVFVARELGKWPRDFHTI